LATCVEEEEYNHSIFQSLEGNFALRMDHMLLENNPEVELGDNLDFERDFEVGNSDHGYANNPKQCD
jgi:hypothetical protein